MTRTTTAPTTADDHAVDIQAGDRGCSEQREEVAANYGADDGPNTISSNRPSPDLLTILLAMKPAMRPKTSHPRHGIPCNFDLEQR